jgi:3alpha(or 20beta)-hydroxysteroid dehydrogenase
VSPDRHHSVEQDQEAGLRELEGKVALITGAARGQGAEEARLLAAEGATVIIADIAEPESAALAASLPNAASVRLDVASAESWDAAMAMIRGTHGRLDILVNNAAVVHFSTIEEIELADFMRVIEINLAGTLLGMQKAIPLMKKGGGAIVNISSISGLLGRDNQPAYLASKWAVRGLTRAASMEFAKYAIRVNTIVPGLIATEMTRAAYGEEKLKARGLTLPAGRPGEPRDIANLLLFLVSPMSSFCTGAEFVCDGGETAGFRI